MSEEGSGPQREASPARSSAHGPAPREGWAVHLLKGFVDILGLGPRTRVEHGPVATDTGSRLALERTCLASERTLMGWIRTALSMISFGFTIGKLGQTFSNVEVKGVFHRVRMVGVEGIAYFLVILGSAALFAATVQHIVRVREYRLQGLEWRPRGLTVVVAILLVIVGVFALSSLVMKL